MSSELPVHGFVLAGGRSSRMGRDKALAMFRSRPMVGIAVEKLRMFCAEVSIAGNRDDLLPFASVVHERHLGAGPAAGLEAGLAASTEVWSMFVPVDVPLVPASLLRNWGEAVVSRGLEGCRFSVLQVARDRQPAFCMLHKDCLPGVRSALAEQIHKLTTVFDRVGMLLPENSLWTADAEAFVPSPKLTETPWDLWFSNVNTPEQLEEAERRGAEIES